MHVQTRSAAGFQIQFWQGQQNLFCFFSWSRAGIWLEGKKRVMTTGGRAIFIMIAAGCFEGLGFRVWQNSHYSSFFGFQVLGESVDVELLFCYCTVGFAASEDNIWSAHCDRCPWSLSGFFHIQPAPSQEYWFWALWLTSSNKAQKQSWRVTKLVTLNLGLCIIVWAGGKGGRHYTNSSILMPTGKCTPSLIWVLGFMVKPVEFWWMLLYSCYEPWFSSWSQTHWTYTSNVADRFAGSCCKNRKSDQHQEGSILCILCKPLFIVFPCLSFPFVFLFLFCHSLFLCLVIVVVVCC